MACVELKMHQSTHSQGDHNTLPVESAFNEMEPDTPDDVRKNENSVQGAKSLEGSDHKFESERTALEMQPMETPNLDPRARACPGLNADEGDDGFQEATNVKRSGNEEETQAHDLNSKIAAESCAAVASDHMDGKPSDLEEATLTYDSEDAKLAGEANATSTMANASTENGGEGSDKENVTLDYDLDPSAVDGDEDGGQVFIRANAIQAVQAYTLYCAC